MRISSLLLFLISLAITACTTTNAPAPVSEVAAKPAPPVTPVISTKNKASTSNIKPTDKDWRPDNYVVKKGDTLYSIGLEHGFDYKEIAQMNQIEAPYTIKVGQSLKLTDLKTGAVKTKPVEKKLDEPVLTKPLGADSYAPQGKPLEEIPVKSAAENAVAKTTTELPESELTAPTTATNVVPSTPITVPPNSTAPNNPANAPTTPAKESVDINDKLVSQSRPNNNTYTGTMPSSGIDWAWPAKGKITNPFSEGGNAKGIDIEGSLGQEIYAAASGKVIYNGGDLRGYGNMIIIKHDKDYLSVYAHNSKTNVKEGQSITKGQKIAEMGNSGTDKVKLHFEIRFQGKSVDPVKFLGNLP